MTTNIPDLSKTERIGECPLMEPHIPTVGFNYWDINFANYKLNTNISGVNDYGNSGVRLNTVIEHLKSAPITKNEDGLARLYRGGPYIPQDTQVFKDLTNVEGNPIELEYFNNKKAYPGLFMFSHAVIVNVENNAYNELFGLTGFSKPGEQIFDMRVESGTLEGSYYCKGEYQGGGGPFIGKIWPGVIIGNPTITGINEQGLNGAGFTTRYFRLTGPFPSNTFGTTSAFGYTGFQKAYFVGHFTVSYKNTNTSSESARRFVKLPIVIAFNGPTEQLYGARPFHDPPYMYISSASGGNLYYQKKNDGLIDTSNFVISIRDNGFLTQFNRRQLFPNNLPEGLRLRNVHLREVKNRTNGGPVRTYDHLTGSQYVTTNHALSNKNWPYGLLAIRGLHYSPPGGWSSGPRPDLEFKLRLIFEEYSYGESELKYHDVSITMKHL